MLKAKGISKKYFRETKESNYFTALEPCDIELKSGSLSVLMGRSGSGKSTLLTILAGLLKPTEGSVNVMDTDIYSLSDKSLSKFRNKNIGVVPQGYTALFNLTVAENIMLPASMYGAGRSEEKQVREYTRSLMESFGIYDLRNELPDKLSGGEMRRMAIARGVIARPGLILADEPTGDLDDENTDMILKFFRKLADEGAAVLIVTHENVALQYADQEYMMSAGVLTRKHA